MTNFYINLIVSIIPINVVYLCTFNQCLYTICAATAACNWHRPENRCSAARRPPELCRFLSVVYFFAHCLALDTVVGDGAGSSRVLRARRAVFCRVYSRVLECTRRGAGRKHKKIYYIQSTCVCVLFLCCGGEKMPSLACARGVGGKANV